jgi:hypothetical protein
MDLLISAARPVKCTNKTLQSFLKNGIIPSAGVIIVGSKQNVELSLIIWNGMTIRPQLK